MFKTPLCELLNIQYPIMQGGMAWVATAELAAAVSEAGGLGIIGAGNAPAEIVRNEIRKAKKLTQKPFGVNVYYLTPYLEDVIDVVVAEKVAVITTGAGNPGKHLSKLKENGTKVIPVVSSVALAKRLERSGVDGIIAEGMECGGHVGDITTMALIPQIVDAVSIPVIGAGGIADGRGFVAALALGAAGVQIGTRFVCAQECIVHENYKKAIVDAKDRDTVLTGAQGHYVRVIRNKLAMEFEKMINTNAPYLEIEKLGTGKLKAAAIDGDIKNGSIMAGQIAGLIHNVKPAADIITEILTQGEETLQKLGKYDF